jgi:hypothetical protein
VKGDPGREVFTNVVFNKFVLFFDGYPGKRSRNRYIIHESASTE